MKIITSVFFDSVELQKIIKKQHFYNNCQDPEKEIKKIITFANYHDATTKNIYKIAKSFFDNSLQDDFYANKNEFIQDTMKYINDTCVVTYYTICEGREV